MAKIISHVNRYIGRLEKEAQGALQEVAIRLQREFSRRVSRNASPPPSAPGESPHKRTGTLGRSMQVDLSRIKNLVVRVGSHLKYSRYLEFGTSKMRARPWLRPAVHQNRRRLSRIMAKRLKRARRALPRA